MHIYLFVILIFLFPSSLQAQKLSRIGIFDATVDWGTVQYPPKHGEHKTNGWVDVSNSNGYWQYHIYGNGDYLLPSHPEGLFLYTEKSGSMSLTAKLEVIEPGGDLPSIGLMIRDNLSQSSKFFYVSIPYSQNENSLRVNVGATLTENGDHTYFIGETIPKTFNGLYLRVTRITPENTCFGEWSNDGVHWKFIHELDLDLSEKANYGIVVSNMVDNDSLTHVKATDVTFEPAPSLTVQRKIPGIYFPDKPLQVSIEINNTSNQPLPLQLKEQLPEGWSILEAIQAYKIDSKQLNWNLIAKSGITTLDYIALPVSSEINSALFSGTFGNKEIYGEWYIKEGKYQYPGAYQPIWRVWKAEDGILSPIKKISVGERGDVIIKRDLEDWFALLDGYSIEYFPDNKRGMPVLGVDGDIWSVTRENHNMTKTGSKLTLQTFDQNIWKTHHIGAIQDSQIFPTIIPYSKTQIILVDSYRVVLYNPLTNTSSIVRNASDSLLTKFLPEISFFQPNFGDPWIIGENGLAKITTLSQLSPPSNIEWNEFEYDQSLKLLGIHFGPYYNYKGDIYFAYLDSAVQSKICKFNGNRWDIIHDGHGGHVFVDSNKHIWLYDSIEKNSVYHIDKPKNMQSGIQEFFQGQSVDIGHDAEGAFWVATREGVYRHSTQVWTVPENISGLQSPVFSIHEDKSKQLWFASTEFLVCNENDDWFLFPYPSLTVFHHENIVQHKLVSDQNQHIKVGSFKVQSGASGLFPLRFIPTKQKFQIEYDIPGDQIVGMNKGKNQSIWEVYLDKKTQSYHVVNSVDERVFNIRYENQPSVFPFVIAEDEYGSVWLNVENRLTVYENEQLRYFGPEEGFDGVNPLSMTGDHKGELWLGTQNAIYKFDGKFWTKVKDGLTQVYDLTVDSRNDLWAATGNGIYCYRDSTWIQITTDEGLASDLVFSIFEDSQGRIWAGTAAGISLYHPLHDTDPPETYIPPDINIREFASGEIQMNYGGIDRWKLTHKERLLFSTKLNGQKWSPFTSSTIFSSKNISAGKHMFQVRSMDRNFNIDPTPAVFSFQVLPIPLQEKVWFLPLVYSTMILILILVVFLYNARDKLRIYAVNLESIVKQRTEDLRKTERHLLRVAESEQQRIGQELHDEVVQDLVGVAINSEMLYKELEPLAHDQAHELHEIIKRMDQSIDKTRKMAKGLSPVDIGENGLEGSLQSLCSHIESVFHVPCSIVGSWETSLLNSETILNVYRIIQEAVTNAAKHSHAKKIIIHLQEDNKHWLATIVDDGLGHEFHTRESAGMGLHIMRYRAHQIGAELQIGSLRNQGTQIRCSIPKHTAPNTV